MRIKRDKEAQYAYPPFVVFLSPPLLTSAPPCRREKEREEIEARRALPEALRMKEDTERAQKSRDEKKKGQQGDSLLPSSPRHFHPH
jgi:microfibrillar-associated protein 1